MAKKSFLSLLFSFFVANFFTLNATNLENASKFLTDTCEAPPPDSFRILDAGAHYVILAWNPTDPMATYTIVVQKGGGNANTWENVDTISNVTGSSITIQNLLYGSKYQFELATNCGNGDPSKLKIYAGPPIGVILDLVLDGRMPVNPSPVPNCQPIIIQNYNWVGFKVESGQNLGSDINFFEFGIGADGVPVIKRAIYGPKIVATNNVGTYPLNPAPKIIELNTPTFLIKRVDGLFPVTIGKVTVHYDPGANPPKVKFCKDDPSWSSGYVFTPITATMANGFQHPPVFDKSLGEKTNEDFILVSTPVSESIKINFGANFEALNDCSLQIHDLAGRIVLQDKSSVINNEITVFFEQHPPGIYILTVRAKGITKTVKVIKI